MDRKPIIRRSDPAAFSFVQEFWVRFIIAPRSAVRRYSVAVILAVFSLLLVGVVNRVEGITLTSFAMLSVILSALYGGRGPAVLDALISSVGVDFLFGEPGLLAFDSWASFLRILNYLTTGFIVAWVVASLRQAFAASHAQYLNAEKEKQARENVLAVVSHDLRSPLSSIFMNTALIKRFSETGKSLSDAARSLEAIQTSASMMNRLIEDLLDATKIEKGQFKIQPRETPVAPIVEQAIDNTQAAAKEKGIKLEVLMPHEQVTVYCDPDRIVQVLCNLLGNAAKFAPSGSTISLEVAPRQDSISFSVRDQGPGIPVQDQPHLFTRYWQAPASAHKGTGLGLFISNSIIQAHGGSISVESASSRGATFRFALPSSKAAHERMLHTHENAV